MLPALKAASCWVLLQHFIKIIILEVVPHNFCYLTVWKLLKFPSKLYSFHYLEERWNKVFMTEVEVCDNWDKFLFCHNILLVVISNSKQTSVKCHFHLRILKLCNQEIRVNLKWKSVWFQILHENTQLQTTS